MNTKSKKLAITGITAALYVVLTLAIAPASYGPVQFRISEMLVLLAFIDDDYIPGILLGCIIANFFSPLGIIDVFFGTLSTGCAVYFMRKTKNMFAATLLPTFFCFIIGLELHIVYDLPYFITTLSVMAGEFGVCTVLGYPVLKLLHKNNSILRILKINKKA